MIKQYIESKKFAWAPTTLKSEEMRLNAIKHLLNGNAEELWKHVKNNYSSYSRVTIWTRVCDYWDFCNQDGQPNPYSTFRRRNARLFKHSYTPTFPGMTYEEAKEKIKQIENEADRTLAEQILGSGERFSEAIQSGSNIIGKGNKPRHVFRPSGTDQSYNRHRTSFSRSLSKVGLKPHSLRKLLASRLVELGMKEADLLKVMGWESMQTAKCYLQPKNDAELARIFKEQIHESL